MAKKGGIIGAIITVVRGGTAFSVSRTDIVKNFSNDTGMSQEEAQKYVENITEDDLFSYDEIGSDFISDGEEILRVASDIDCINYKYEWETNTLSCEEGKSQLKSYGTNEVALGKAYTALASESATKDDIPLAINLIDKHNANLNLDIINQFFDYSEIDEIRKTNSYNKAVLQSVLDSEEE